MKLRGLYLTEILRISAGKAASQTKELEEKFKFAADAIRRQNEIGKEARIEDRCAKCGAAVKPGDKQCQCGSAEKLFFVIYPAAIKSKIVGPTQLKAKNLPVRKFTYRSHSRSRDPWHGNTKPSAIVLGTYTHPSSHKKHVAAIDWEYLDGFEREVLQRYLRFIMNEPNLRDRWRLFGKSGEGEINAKYKQFFKPEIDSGEMPTTIRSGDVAAMRMIFNRAYRTYRDEAIFGASKGRISIK